MRYFLILFLFGCAVQETKTVSTAPIQVDLEDLKKKCENESHTLSCARYGYLAKDLSYTRHACYLGDQNSCFNVQEVENRAPNQNYAIINSHQGQIFGCYVNNSIDENNGEGVKKDKEIDLVFNINLEGKISSLSVIGQKLSQKFIDCVKSSFTARKFIAVDREQSIRYSMTMPEVATDKRLKGKRKTLVD